MCLFPTLPGWHPAPVPIARYAVLLRGVQQQITAEPLRVSTVVGAPVPSLVGTPGSGFKAMLLFFPNIPPQVATL